MVSQVHLCRPVSGATDDAVVVRFTGRVLLLDETNDGALLADEIFRAAEGAAGHEVRLNLRNVGLVNTAALVALLRLRRRLLAAGKRLSLWNLAPAVAEVFDSTRLGRLFDIRSGNPGQVAPEAAHAWN